MNSYLQIVEIVLSSTNSIEVVISIIVIYE